MFCHNRRSGAVPHVSNRMKRSNLQKRDKTYFVLGCAGCAGCAGERISLLCRQVASKWADGLGQVPCQYGIFVKLRTSCPCEVEFEGVLFFLEGDWYVHKTAVWECFDIGTWTRRISSRVLARQSMKRIGHRIFLLLPSVRVKSFVKSTGCLFVRQENESRVFCLSPPTGWMVWIDWVEEEVRPLQILCQNMVSTWYHVASLTRSGYQLQRSRRHFPKQ